MKNFLYSLFTSAFSTIVHARDLNDDTTNNNDNTITDDYTDTTLESMMEKVCSSNIDNDQDIIDRMVSFSAILENGLISEGVNIKFQNNTVSGCDVNKVVNKSTTLKASYAILEVTNSVTQEKTYKVSINGDLDETNIEASYKYLEEIYDDIKSYIEVNDIKSDDVQIYSTGFGCAVADALHSSHDITAYGYNGPGGKGLTDRITGFKAVDTSSDFTMFQFIPNQINTASTFVSKHDIKVLSADVSCTDLKQKDLKIEGVDEIEASDTNVISTQGVFNSTQCLQSHKNYDLGMQIKPFSGSENTDTIPSDFCPYGDGEEYYGKNVTTVLKDSDSNCLEFPSATWMKMEGNNNGGRCFGYTPRHDTPSLDGSSMLPILGYSLGGTALFFGGLYCAYKYCNSGTRLAGNTNTHQGDNDIEYHLDTL